MRRQILTTILVRGGVLLAGVAASVVAARFLGPEGRGQYFFVVVLATAVVQFGSLGLHASNTYQVAQDRQLLRPLLANSLWVALVVGIAAGAVVPLAARALDLFPHTPHHLLWFVIPLAPTTLFYLLGMNLLVGIGRIGTFNGIEAVSQVVALLLLLSAGLLSYGPSGFLAASVLTWTAMAALVLALLVRRGGEGGMGFRPDVFRSGFRFATKTYLTILLAFLVLRCNVFLVKHFVGSTELGYYSIATQIADALIILPTSVSLVLFPHLVRAQATSWSATRRSFVATGVVLAGACVVIALIAEPLITTLFGDEFEPAALMLRLMLPGVFAIGLTTVLSQYLAALGFPRVMIGVWMIGLAVAVPLGVALVRSYEGEGAAAALSVTYAILFALMAAAALHYRPARREG